MDETFPPDAGGDAGKDRVIRLCGNDNWAVSASGRVVRRHSLASDARRKGVSLEINWYVGSKANEPEITSDDTPSRSNLAIQGVSPHELGHRNSHCVFVSEVFCGCMARAGANESIEVDIQSDIEFIVLAAMIRDLLIPAVNDVFPHLQFRISASSNPIISLSSGSVEIGDLQIYDDENEATDRDNRNHSRAFQCL